MKFPREIRSRSVALILATLALTLPVCPGAAADDATRYKIRNR